MPISYHLLDCKALLGNRKKRYSKCSTFTFFWKRDPEIAICLILNPGIENLIPRLQSLVTHPQICDWVCGRDCNPGIPAVFGMGGVLISGLQISVKIVPFRMLNDTIKNSSCRKNKILKCSLESYSLLCIVICILTVTVTPYTLGIPFIGAYRPTMIVCIIKSIGNSIMTTYL